MTGPLTLEELKKEALKKSHLIIRRNGETAWRSLVDWKGHASNVTYYLVGNKVLVRKEPDEQVQWYTLA